MKYVAEDGAEFSDADITAWQAQAENNFAGASVTPMRGRAWERSAPMETHTVRVPAALWKLVETAAAEQGLSVSEYTRHALTRSLI